MPRPKGSQNVASGKGGFALSKRLDTIKDLQKRMEEHLEAATKDVVIAIDKVHDDVRTLANSLPQGDRREQLLSAARTLRTICGNLGKEDSPKRVSSLIPDPRKNSDAILDDVERAV